jgi:DNA-binding transcriptional regulator YiaG
MADSSYDENKEGRVLKTDVLGRVKTGVPQREAILDEFERSGLSGTKFAAVAGVNYQTFASWVQKRRKVTGAYPKKAVCVKPSTPERCLTWRLTVCGSSAS